MFMKIQVLLDVTLCQIVNNCQHSGGVCYLCIQGCNCQTMKVVAAHFPLMCLFSSQHDITSKKTDNFEKVQCFQCQVSNSWQCSCSMRNSNIDSNLASGEYWCNFDCNICKKLINVNINFIYCVLFSGHSHATCMHLVSAGNCVWSSWESSALLPI